MRKKPNGDAIAPLALQMFRRAQALICQPATYLTAPYQLRNATSGHNGLAERTVDKASGVKGLSPEAMGAQRAPLRPPALSTTLSQAVYAGSQVKTVLAWDFHISPEDTCPKAIVT